MLTQKRLKEVLKYDPETGIFMWATSRPKASKGNVAGSKHNGYVRITVHGFKYSGHRLAWLHVYGYFPENQIDHIDKNKSNNRIKNLREVSPQCNTRNTGNRSDTTSEVKGVSWYIGSDKWHVRIKVDGKDIYLGKHSDFTEAACHRLAAEQAEDWAGCDSSSPAYQYVKKHIPTIK